MLFSPSTPPLAGTRFVCMEGIRDVQIKGLHGSEKVFVGIERRIGPIPESLFSSTEDEETIRSVMWRADSNDLGPSTTIIERRNIVFMQSKTPSVAAGDAAVPSQGTKVVRAVHTPTFSHTLIPTPQLLFRYSALTFNAHSIHLDKSYCREVEGHRNLLVHGPLSLTLMLEVLRRYLIDIFPERPPRVDEVEYRNLAPLYAEEPMTVCGREIRVGSDGDGEYEVWVEGKEGGYAVRGKVRTSSRV